MSAFYNEHDKHAATWLRELIKRGLIADGEVDERSIVDVEPSDLRGFTQCHFFAGIGVWSHALRGAGWPDYRPVWTGSCPCQPFSAAGKGEGYNDERHLWPHWLRLISECRPPAIFGEQVDAAIRTGWLDDVCLSLEQLDYAVGSVSFPACSVGAPHIRQRLYFVAESNHAKRGADSRNDVGHGELADELGNAEQQGSQRRVRGGANEGREVESGHAGRNGPTNGFWSNAEWIACRDGKSRPTGQGISPLVVANSSRMGQRGGRASGKIPESSEVERSTGLREIGSERQRPTESSFEPLAHGSAARVVRLRGYGNAIVAPAAQAFITAYMDAA